MKHKKQLSGAAAWPIDYKGWKKGGVEERWASSLPKSAIPSSQRRSSRSKSKNYGAFRLQRFQRSKGPKHY